MFELSSKDDLFEFTYDGAVHALVALRVEDVESLTAVMTEGSPTKRAAAMKVELRARAVGDAGAVVDGLALKNTAELFKAWAGIRLGESLSSDES